MRRSLNEITVEIRRAFVGAGFPYGLAEEASRSAGALFRVGMDGSLAALEMLDCQEPANRCFELAGLLGAFERCIAAASPETLETVQTPLMLVGTGMQLSLATGTGFVIVSGSDEWRITPAGLEGPTAFAPDGPVELRVLPQADPTDLQMPPEAVNGIEINEERWPIVRAWARKTFVPASEQSRLAGAGAGLNDND